MSRPMPGARDHAVVVGGSMAGLAAARVLAEHYARVTVLDRDVLPADARFRKGVPQGLHAHALLARGREALETLFPGLGAELVAAGAIESDLFADSVWFNHGVRLAAAPSGLIGLLVSRPMLEGLVRRRLMERRNVRLLERCEVRGPTFDSRLDCVTGLEIDVGEGRQILAADLVVDASGRFSRSPSWLQELGFEPPSVDEVEVGIGYTTRLYRRRSGDAGGKRVVAVRGGAPRYRFGVALAQEDDRWIVSLGGYFGGNPPADQESYDAFARSLPVTEIADIVANAEPLSPFRGFRFPASVRRRYERLPRFPAGYLVTGDALCSFNPAYGQGMAAAILEAMALRDCLASATGPLAPRFFSAAAKIVDTPWQIAVGGDLEHPLVKGERTLSGRMLSWYIRWLHRAGALDASLGVRFLEVANLLAPPAALLAPAIAMKVLRGNLRRLHHTAGQARGASLLGGLGSVFR
ncbi:MAG: FAD-binding monooxygenase [Hyphomicrobium sp.]|uniref:FAD-dependent oxidoreductase n=1 Tax=Hyphomicrobium sp. TaxID=82 RepID=UPI0025C0FBCC|nr:FAD-binding monooxygenase [Hyphomicrobium sp.]MBZ0208390.1 FAD-binding monooxygenase [Hyphomicrobium sp.]